MTRLFRLREILSRFLHQLSETHLNKKGGLKMGILLILEILAEIIDPSLTVEDKVT